MIVRVSIPLGFPYQGVPPMSRRFLLIGLAIVAVAMLLSASSAQAGLFGRLGGCCEPACCEPAACEPVECCDPCAKPKRCGLFGGLFARCKANACCEPAACEPVECCEPAACEPVECCEPAACEPECFDPCCKPKRCGGRLRGLFARCKATACCEPETCEPAGCCN